MKPIFLALLLAFTASSLCAQGFVTSLGPDGTIMSSDTTDARYAKILYYDTTGVFTIPKGAHGVSIANTGGVDGLVQTDTSTGLRSFPDGAPPLNFGALDPVFIRRIPYIVLPTFECDATGTRFTVIEYR